MPTKIKLKHTITPEQEKAMFRGTLAEIHDRLNEIVSKMGKISYYVPYTQEEIGMFNKRVGDYSFELPEATGELIKVGNAMHICVGNLYSKKATDKQCRIVVMYDKNRKPVVCIEVSGYNEKAEIRQIKANSNALATKYAEEIASYLNEVKIPATCYDARILNGVKGSIKVENLKTRKEYLIYETKEDVLNLNQSLIPEKGEEFLSLLAS